MKASYTYLIILMFEDIIINIWRAHVVHLHRRGQHCQCSSSFLTRTLQVDTRFN